MLTRKQYRTIKQIKPYIITTIAIGTILIANTILNNQAKAQLQREAEAYKQCIIQQSETQGYIIRSYCSLNYKQLDRLSKLEYTQKGYDLYLK
jgi:hypothetical protein